MKGNSKESYSSLDELSGNSEDSVEVKSIPDTRRSRIW